MTDMTDRVHPEATHWNHEWSWSEPKRDEHFRRCSYCGSVNPEDLATEPAWLAEWADAKYGWPHKFYVDIPNRHPDVKVPTSVRSAPSSEGGWINAPDLSDEQRASLADHGFEVGPAMSYAFRPRPTHHAKFYTVHLADPALTPEVRKVIEQRSGLSFTWTDDGRVSWKRAT